MKPIAPFVLFVFAGCLAVSTHLFAARTTGADAGASSQSSISLAAFADSAHHWRDIKDKAAVIKPRPNHPVCKPSQIREIAANILLFQRANGGWPKNYDMAAILNAGERAAVAASRQANDTTFDNDTCHSHIVYLSKAARIIEQTGASADLALARDYREAARRGIEFVLSAQYANGGFPQGWPNPRGYAACITFNDGVMTGILEVLRDIAGRARHFEWVEPALREKCRGALERGIACLLACQYRVPADAAPADGNPNPFAGKLTGWGQQHNHTTLKPANARVFELASLCAEDTAGIAQFLMELEKPSPAIISAVQAAAAWLDTVAIEGARLETYKSNPVEFEYHNTSIDRRVTADPQAPRIWARMYELDTNRPIFCRRDGVKRYDLSEIDRDRRTGYTWYGYWPAQMMKKHYPAWLEKHGLAK